MNSIDELLRRLQAEEAVLVSVERTSGSTPREVGAWMAVFADSVLGSVGGGQLEHQAIAQARARLADASDANPDPDAGADAEAGRDALLRYPLGPTLGQCCGGVMFLRFERVAAGDAAGQAALASRLQRATMQVALFGGGHVGNALVRLLGTLPCQVLWIDSRDGIFPVQLAGNVSCEQSDPVQAAVPDLAPFSHVLIMSFSHAEDLDIVAACLLRQRHLADLGSIGLIGSRSKWATFRHRLEQRGFTQAELDRVTSPIGVPGVQGKEPEVIALAAAAQLLQRRNPQS
jgi:xanthine dehydrogenase accessory factor